MSVKPIPDGYHSVTPYITVDYAAKAIDFYKASFGATEIARMDMGGKIGHAEIRIGDSVVMLSDEFPDRGKLGPKARGGATSSLMVYLPDVDAAFRGPLTPVPRNRWRSRINSGAIGWEIGRAHV